MCGIVGMIQGYREQPADKRAARAMASALLHRGPDDEGFYFRGPVALGMRRLAIIDLPGGHQPISNEDASVWVVFNGEIYNHEALREDLIGRGHRFSTRSDTEVIVHLYEEVGDALVDHLNGMFAFALWDEREERLLLARDRMGEKPLYYARFDDGGLAFASELKALVQDPRVRREIDLRSLRKYLAYEFVPSPHSIISGARKLPPAHRLIWTRREMKIERYWSLDYGVPKLRISEEEAAEEVRVRLGAAVASRLVADVPLGVLLSGGIDSSSVAALACESARASGGERIKTFSIAFRERSFDESAYARAVAEQIGAEHHERTFTERDLLDLVAELPRLLDEPLGDGSLLPTYLLSRFTREHVKVALGGDGGDEMFAGYPTYIAHRLAGLYRALPAIVRERLIEPGIGRLPVSLDNLSLDFRAKRFIHGALLPAGMRHTVWMGSFDGEAQRQLLTPEALEAALDEEVFDEVREFDLSPPKNGRWSGRKNGPGSEKARESLIERMMRLDATHYLSECVLVKVDRASMASSLEVRAPFLDHTLVEFLARLPADLKLRRLTTKYILKRAMRERLPRAVTRRPKKGFGMPVAKWLKGELRDLAREAFAPARLRRHGLFNPDYVARLLDEHERGVADHRKPLWTLLMFELWPGSIP